MDLRHYNTLNFMSLVYFKMNFASMASFLYPVHVKFMSIIYIFKMKRSKMLVVYLSFSGATWGGVATVEHWCTSLCSADHAIQNGMTFSVREGG